MNNTRTPIKFTKEFDSKYNSPAMKLHLMEQGWKYKGNNGDNPIFEFYQG